MKKILVFFLIILSFKTYSQTQPYLPLGSPAGNTLSVVNGLNGLQMPHGSDTPNIAGSRGLLKDSIGMLFFKTIDNTVWIRTSVYEGVNEWVQMSTGSSALENWDKSLDIQGSDPFLASHTVDLGSTDFALNNANSFTFSTSVSGIVGNAGTVTISADNSEHLTTDSILASPLSGFGDGFVMADNTGLLLWVDLLGATNNITVIVASTGNVDIADPGTSTFNGVAMLDGYSTILLWKQDNKAENGAYLFNGIHAPLTRLTTADDAAELNDEVVFVLSGTQYARRYFNQVATVVTVDTDPVIYHINKIGGNGAAGSLFPTSGTGTATSNVIGDLAGFTLSAHQDGNNFLFIDPTLNNEYSLLQAFNPTGNQGLFEGHTTDTSAETDNVASYQDAFTAQIKAHASAMGSYITYTADTHAFMGGNVGIGTSTPSVALDVVGDVRFTSISDDYSISAINDVITMTATEIGFIGSSVFTGNPIPSADNTYNLGSASKQWKDFYLKGIQNFGNGTNSNLVSIQSGVTSASYTLTLPTAQGGANTFLQNDGSGNLSWATNSSGWSLTGNTGTNSGSNWIGTNDNASIAFHTNAIQRMIIDSLGNVGIGTVPIADQLFVVHNGVNDKLFVNNAVGAEMSGIKSNDAVGYSFANFYSNTDGDGYGFFLSANDGTNTVTINADAPSQKIKFTGNVLPSASNTYDLGSASNQWKDFYLKGIQKFGNGTNSNLVSIQSGVTSASYTLTLPTAVAASTGYVLTSTNAGVLSWADPASTAWKLLGNSGTTAGTNFIGTTDAIALVMKTNNTEKMRILSNGNIGINQASPNNLLEVNGTFYEAGDAVLTRVSGTIGFFASAPNSDYLISSNYGSNGSASATYGTINIGSGNSFPINGQTMYAIHIIPNLNSTGTTSAYTGYYLGTTTSDNAAWSIGNFRGFDLNYTTLSNSSTHNGSYEAFRNSMAFAASSNVNVQYDTVYAFHDRSITSVSGSDTAVSKFYASFAADSMNALFYKGATTIYHFLDRANAANTILNLFESPTTFVSTMTMTSLAGTGSRAVLADANGVLSAPISDFTVKQNIQSLDYGLNEIMKLKPVSFEYIDGWQNYGTGKQIGFIAQDIQKILPNSVFTTPSTGKMGYNEQDLIPVLVSAMQQMQAEITDLKKQIRKQK